MLSEVDSNIRKNGMVPEALKQKIRDYANNKLDAVYQTDKGSFKDNVNAALDDYIQESKVLLSAA